MSLRRLAVGLALVSGCAAESTLSEPLPDLGWLTQVSQHPDAFSQLMDESSRDGWIALHQNDFKKAAVAFSQHPLHRARATSELAAFEADLAQMSGSANLTLYTAWDERGTLPSTGAAVSAAMAASCSGAVATAWAQRVPSTDPAFDVAQRLLANEEFYTANLDNALSTRLRHHASADPEALTLDAATPLFVQDSPDGTHQFWDPCIYRSLQRHWDDVTHTDLGDAGFQAWTQDGLGGLLFAPWLSADGLQEDLTASRPLGIGGAGVFGISPTLPATFDDAQAAREESRVLTAALDEQMVLLTDAASTDGRALLADLGLAERWRQRWHLARARQARDAGRARQALAYADMGRQMSEPVGPLNPPGLLVVSAHAQLELGHTREALDTLHSLRQGTPEILGLIEVLGDLAVLRGLDRNGDSKEN